MNISMTASRQKENKFVRKELNTCMAAQGKPKEPVAVSATL
jgi:hypothetical protein